MAARSAGFFVPGALGIQELGLVIVGGLVGLHADTAMLIAVVKRLRDVAIGVPGLVIWQWLEGRRFPATRTAPVIAGENRLPTRQSEPRVSGSALRGRSRRASGRHDVRLPRLSIGERTDRGFPVDPEPCRIGCKALALGLGIDLIQCPGVAGWRSVRQAIPLPRRQSSEPPRGVEADPEMLVQALHRAHRIADEITKMDMKDRFGEWLLIGGADHQLGRLGPALAFLPRQRECDPDAC